MHLESKKQRIILGTSTSDQHILEVNFLLLYTLFEIASESALLDKKPKLMHFAMAMRYFHFTIAKFYFLSTAQSLTCIRPRDPHMGIPGIHVHVTRHLQN